ncbi:hypothetical protein V6N13_011106 [Hibiscus sabdariffa]
MQSSQRICHYKGNALQNIDRNQGSKPYATAKDLTSEVNKFPINSSGLRAANRSVTENSGNRGPLFPPNRHLKKIFLLDNVNREGKRDET